MGNFLFYLSSLLFGLGSWVAITGLWLETPLLIHYLPEKWALSSYLTFSIQLANIVVIVYWFLNYKFPKYFNEVSGTNGQLFVGISASIVLIFHWDTQMNLFGQPHSIVLFVCAFSLSIVDCLSSVTFLPYMSKFDPKFLTPYLIGEGLSGFLPMILATLQNVDENYGPDDFPEDQSDQNSTDFANSTLNEEKFDSGSIGAGLNFPPEIFFISLVITILISWSAFFYLQFHEPEHPGRVRRSFGAKLKKYLFGIEAKFALPESEHLKREDTIVQPASRPLIKSRNNVTILPSTRNRRTKRFEKFEYYYLQFLILFACTITFGILPPLQPFSLLPISQSALKCAVILSGLAYPAGCSIGLFIKCKSTKMLTLLTLLAAFIAGFIFWSALYSPNLPPFLTATDKQEIDFDDQSLNGTEPAYTVLSTEFNVELTDGYRVEYNATNGGAEQDSLYDGSELLDSFLTESNYSLVVSVFMISCWTLFSLILSYVKTMVTIKLNDKNGQEALFYVGLFSQFGSLFGSGVMMILINQLKLFKQTSPQ